MKISTRIVSMALTLVLMIGALAVPTFAAEKNIMYGIGFVNTNGLRLRSEATTNSKTLDTASKNDCVVIVEKVGDWYKVNYNLQEGYMYGSYLNVLTKENAELGYGKVTGSAVNLRSGPSTSRAVVSVASAGSKCYILGLNEGWYKVIYGTNICYIRSDYLELTEIPYENQDSAKSPKFFRGGKSTGVLPSAAVLNGTTSNNSNSGNTSTGSSVGSASGSSIVAEAKKYLGTPYIYGGASPSGFDCSGFVYYVLKQNGFSPYRTPADQYNQGTYVAKANLQPGDIVFFAGTGSSNAISHVGIYVGGGQMIHSPNSRSTVSYADITSGYWANHYYGTRRMA